MWHQCTPHICLPPQPTVEGIFSSTTEQGKNWYFHARSYKTILTVFFCSLVGSSQLQYDHLWTPLQPSEEITLVMLEVCRIILPLPCLCCLFPWQESEISQKEISWNASTYRGSNAKAIFCQSICCYYLPVYFLSTSSLCCLCISHYSLFSPFRVRRHPVVMGEPPEETNTHKKRDASSTWALMSDCSILCPRIQ